MNEAGEPELVRGNDGMIRSGKMVYVVAGTDSWISAIRPETDLSSGTVLMHLGSNETSAPRPADDGLRRRQETHLRARTDGRVPTQTSRD